MLDHTQTVSGGFGVSSRSADVRPAPSQALHCLHGNLLSALIGFGWLDDPRVQDAIAWSAKAITGEGDFSFYRSGTSGPGFGCAANWREPCAWGAIKELLALGRIPSDRRNPLVARAIEEGVRFLLSRDPLTADYPMGPGNSRPSRSWFKPGFPSGYVADVPQNLEALCLLGEASNPALLPAIEWMVNKQDALGRWKNEYAYNGKTWIDFEPQGQPSKWVTLRACRILKMVAGDSTS